MIVDVCFVSGKFDSFELMCVRARYRQTVIVARSFCALSSVLRRLCCCVFVGYGESMRCHGAARRDRVFHLFLLPPASNPSSAGRQSLSDSTKDSQCPRPLSDGGVVSDRSYPTGWTDPCYVVGSQRAPAPAPAKVSSSTVTGMVVDLPFIGWASSSTIRSSPRARRPRERQAHSNTTRAGWGDQAHGARRRGHASGRRSTAN